MKKEFKGEAYIDKNNTIYHWEFSQKMPEYGNKEIILKKVPVEVIIKFNSENPYEL